MGAGSPHALPPLAGDVATHLTRIKPLVTPGSVAARGTWKTLLPRVDDTLHPPPPPPPTDRGANDADRFLFRGVFLVVVVLAAASLVQGIRMGFASFHHRRALDQLEQHRIADALIDLERAHLWYSGHSRVSWLLARAAMLEQRGQDCAQYLDLIAKDSPRHVDALHLRAQLAERLGRNEQAIAAYGRLHREYPQVISGALGLARLGQSAPLQERLRQIPAAVDSPSWRGIALMHLSDALGSKGYGTHHSAQSLWNARHVGANAVTLRVPGRQRRFDDPHVATDDEPLDGEHLRDIVFDIDVAHQLGLEVLVKPHVMLDEINETQWRGTLTYPSGSAELESWWQDYQHFILTLARICEKHNVEALCVGVELWAMARDYPDRFRNLISEVRLHYSGIVTYAANWFEEYQEIEFWPSLDAVGIQFFFPLTDSEQLPSQDQLLQRVNEVHPLLDDLSWASGKPLLLTEVGYKSTTDGLVAPWKWASEEMQADPEAQRRAYRAILEGFSERQHFMGMFWWNWLTDPDPDTRFRVDFTPQGKPAQFEIEDHWRKK